MSDELKKKDAGPDEVARLGREGEDTEAHKMWTRGGASETEGEGGPDEARKKALAIPDTGDDTEGHRK